MSWSRKAPREVQRILEPHLATPYPLPAVLTSLPYTMHQQLDMSVHLAHRTSSICTAAGSQVEGRTRTL